MNKTISILGLVFLSTTLVTAINARADDGYTPADSDYMKGGLVIGGGTNNNTYDGSTVNTAAGFHGRILRENDFYAKDYGSDGGPNANLEADVRWNILDYNSATGQSSTGLTFRLRGGAVGQLRGINADGCDLFAGPHGAADGEVFTSSRRGSNQITGRAGIETGLECKSGKALLQITPSVELGMMNQFNGRVSQLALDAALRARITDGDKLYASVEGLIGPSGWQLESFDDKNPQKFKTTEVDFTSDYRLSSKWAVGGDVKYVRATSEDPSNPAAINVHDVSVEGRVTRIID